MNATQAEMIRSSRPPVDASGRFVGPMLNNEAWVLTMSDGRELRMARIACWDGRYSWKLEGPCECGQPSLSGGCAFWVDVESDPDRAEPILLSNADAGCHWHHQRAHNH